MLVSYIFLRGTKVPLRTPSVFKVEPLRGSDPHAPSFLFNGKKILPLCPPKVGISKGQRAKLATLTPQRGV